MPDPPACLSVVADYLTFLARYPSFDALYWDCRWGWLIVPVALAGGWPRAGLSLGRAVFRGVLAALAVLMPLNLYWGFPVPVCEGLTALALLTFLLAGPVCALVWLVSRRPGVASLLVLVAAVIAPYGLSFPRMPLAMLTAWAGLLVIPAGALGWLARRKPFLALSMIAAGAVWLGLFGTGLGLPRPGGVWLAFGATLTAGLGCAVAWWTRRRSFAAVCLFPLGLLALVANSWLVESPTQVRWDNCLRGTTDTLWDVWHWGNMTAAVDLAARLGLPEAAGGPWEPPALTAVRGRGDVANALRLLRQWGVALDPAGAAETALGAAVGQGDLRAVRYLLETGADPNRRGSQGDAPLHALRPAQPGPLDKWMVHRDDPAALARLLLAHGADPTLADAAGQLPGQRARERGLVEAADMLDAAAKTQAGP